MVPSSYGFCDCLILGHAFELVCNALATCGCILALLLSIFEILFCFINQADLVFSSDNFSLDVALKIIQLLEGMGEDYRVILKISKELLKRFSRVLEPLHQNFRTLFCLQVGKWIVKANVGDFMRFIEPKTNVQHRMVKPQIRLSFAHGVNHHDMF